MHLAGQSSLANAGITAPLLACAGNALLVPRALRLRNGMFLTATTWGTAGGWLVTAATLGARQVRHCCCSSPGFSAALRQAQAAVPSVLLPNCCVHPHLCQRQVVRHLQLCKSHSSCVPCGLKPPLMHAGPNRDVESVCGVHSAAGPFGRADPPLPPCRMQR